MDRMPESTGLPARNRRARWYFSSPQGHNLKSPLRLEREVKRLRGEIVKDPLTGLYNRRGLEELSEKYIEIWKRSDGRVPLYVFVADLDYFKKVNDTLGHEMGDNLLRGIAKAWWGCLRKEDVITIIDERGALSERSNTEKGTDLSVGRLGGDEFVVLAFATEPRCLEARLKVAFQSVINSLEMPEDLRSKLGFSMGYAKVGEGFGESVDISELPNRELFSKAKEIADIRMYEEKRVKKNGER